MDTKKSVTSLYMMQSLTKGFSVFFFVLLPIFYSKKVITSREIGYIGALFIVLLIIGAVVVAQRLHTVSTRKLLVVSSWMSIFASIVLLIGSLEKNLSLLTLSYAFMGLSVGTAMSGVNVVAAGLTKRGERYKTLARLGMLTDLVRIVFPLIAAGAVALGAYNLAIFIVILAAFTFLMFSSSVTSDIYQVDDSYAINTSKWWTNKPFRYALSLEFFDSFSSSQLFVFLPLLFLAKGHSIQSSLILQSFIFLGYLCGRWLVSYLAKYKTGIKAVAYAEFGMVASLILILTTKELVLLYVLTFALGIFARGTSPAIKALSFDSLDNSQMKQGSALHVVAGDSGSALGQLLFGLLIAWLGVNSPFILAAIIAGLIGLICIFKPIRSSNSEITSPIS